MGRGKAKDTLGDYLARCRGVADCVVTFPLLQQAAIISCVIVNQLIGPVLCKLALKWSGEAGLSAGNEHAVENEADPNAVHVADLNKVIIMGATARSKALAIALLRERWGVSMLTMDQEEAIGLELEIKEWAEMCRAEDAAYAEFHGIQPPALPVRNLEELFRAIVIEGRDTKHPFIRSCSLDQLEKLWYFEPNQPPTNIGMLSSRLERSIDRRSL